jgi:hypothetical protein
MKAVESIPASIEENESMQIARIKLFENIPLNPWIQGSSTPSSPIKLEKNHYSLPILEK